MGPLSPIDNASEYSQIEPLSNNKQGTLVQAESFDSPDESVAAQLFNDMMNNGKKGMAISKSNNFQASTNEQNRRKSNLAMAQQQQTVLATANQHHAQSLQAMLQDQLNSDPSSMSFKAIQGLFMNEDALKMTNDIQSANKDMVHQTLHFEKELKLIEQANRQANIFDKNLKTKARQAKLQLRKQNTKRDFLSVIATPSVMAREELKSVKTSTTLRSQHSQVRILSPDTLPRAKLRKTIDYGQGSPVKLPAIRGSSTTRNQGSSLTAVKQQKNQISRNLRPKSLINHQGGSIMGSGAQKDNKLNLIMIKDYSSLQTDQANLNGIQIGSGNLGVSFGRRVIPTQDRAAERRLIIERRRHLDSLIAGGLKSAGIELDAEEKRMQKLLLSTASSFVIHEENDKVMLPSLEGHENGSPRLGQTSMTSVNDDESEYAIFRTSGMNDKGESPAAAAELQAQTAQQADKNFKMATTIKNQQKRKTRLGIVINKRSLSPTELHEHRIEQQIKRNRTLRLQQESKDEEKKRSANNTAQAPSPNDTAQSPYNYTARSLGGLFAQTEMATGTFYSVQSTNTGLASQWQKNGQFKEAETMPEADQRKHLMDYTFDNTEVDDFLNDPRLLALAQVKFMHGEDKQMEDTQSQSQVREMVAYLLNQDGADEQVELISKKLLDKVYTPEYTSFIQDGTQLTSNYALEVRDKKLYIDLCKQAGRPKLVENSQMNYLLKYYEECRKMGVVPLPILFKVRNKRLVLKGYALNGGLCESLFQSFKIYPELLTSINLTDNGMQDSDLAKVLRGLEQLHCLRSIVIKDNAFHEESCVVLGEILARQIPNNLEELRLIGLKSSPLVTGQLMEKLAENCHLRKLALVAAEITDVHVDDLCQVIKGGRFLIELDLRRNQMTASKMPELTRALAANKALQIINLSWNTFVHATDAGPIVNYNPADDDSEDPDDANEKHVSTKDQYINSDRDITRDSDERRRATLAGTYHKMGDARASTLSLNSGVMASQSGRRSAMESSLDRQAPLDKKRRVHDNYEWLLGKQNEESSMKDGKPTHRAVLVGKQHAELVANVCTMIKRNKSLLHLDLSHTALTEYMLWHIGKALSRARSVTSLHLTGNPGYTRTLMKQLQTRIRCKPQLQYKKIGLKVGLNNSPGSPMVQTQKGRFRAHDEAIVHEKMQMRHLVKHEVENGQGDIGFAKGQKKFIFERKLGHKMDIPGSGQWSMLNEDHQQCWHCANQIYTLVFWSRHFGWSDDSIDPVLEENLVSQIEDINGNFDYKPVTKPVVFSDAGGWRATPLRTLEDFFYDVDKARPNHFEEMKTRGTCRPELESIEEMNAQERERYDLTLQRYKQMNYTSGDDVKKIIIRDLLYKKMQFFNPELLTKLDTGEADSPEHQVFVFAQFFTSGRQTYATAVIDEDQDLQFFTHKIVVPKRDEDVPNFVKLIRTTPIVRTFHRGTSVFAEWRPDGADTARQCIEHDLELWHGDKFIKDEEDREATAEVMLKYADLIKNVFIQIACRSSFPQIGWIDFSAFSNKVELPDARGQGAFGASQVDTQFIAANNGTHAVTGMDPSILMRYKFVEILARIAQSKYTLQKIVPTTAEAVEKLMSEVIQARYHFEPWQDYREDVLYTLEINDVLQANIDGIEKMMEHYYAPRKTYCNKKDIISLFTKDANVMIGEKEAIYCFGMSKMTVVKESVTPKQYDKIELPELCEMICRVADTKFKASTTLTLAQKIELLLDELFVVINYTRKEVNVTQEEQSESDDEY